MFKNLNTKIVEKEIIRTGLAAFDYVSGGLTVGKTYEIRGQQDSETTTLALNIAHSLYTKNFKLLYFDVSSQVKDEQINRLGFSDSYDDTYSFLPSQKIYDVLNDCLEFLQSKKRVLVVIDNLVSLVNDLIRFEDAWKSEAVLEAHQKLRPILGQISLAVKESESILLLVNDQRISQFNYTTPKRYRTKAIEPFFPIHLLGGIVELQHYKSYYQVLNGLHGKEKRNYWGQSVKIRSKSPNFDTPFKSDFLFKSIQRDDFTNIRTVIEVALQQKLIKENRVNKKPVYQSTKINNFPETSGLFNLHALLEGKPELSEEIINLIDWEATCYGSPTENR